ncbi:DUF6531 domain-containing protein [Kitasatospora sp. NPDC004614]|uniref:DUF6531 domain-containing protein n=1 Tax=unclassified Kitasatospora TaxID=2633591 RepID=UPI00368E00A5
MKSPRTEGRPQDTRCGGGEPADIATGRMHIDRVDVSLPGSLPLEFTRNFESGLLTGRWMGQRWRRARRPALDHLKLTAATGAEARFVTEAVAGTDGAQVLTSTAAAAGLFPVERLYATVSAMPLPG